MECDFCENLGFVKRNSCASIISSSLGVTEISDLNLATDLGLNPSYNCWVQILESLRLWSSSAPTSVNRVDGSKGYLLIRRTGNSNWQDVRLVRIEGS